MLLPIIEYRDIFLSAASVLNRKKLQTIQNKGLRCALNKGVFMASTDELHAETGLLKLKYRREQHLLNFIYDWSLDDSRLITRAQNSVVMRSSHKKQFKLKKPNSEKIKKSFTSKGRHKWNALPASLHHTATPKVNIKR